MQQHRQNDWKKTNIRKQHAVQCTASMGFFIIWFFLESHSHKMTSCMIASYKCGEKPTISNRIFRQIRFFGDNEPFMRLLNITYKANSLNTIFDELKPKFSKCSIKNWVLLDLFLSLFIYQVDESLIHRHSTWIPLELCRVIWISANWETNCFVIFLKIDRSKFN